MIQISPGPLSLDHRLELTATNNAKGWRRVLRWFASRRRTNYEIMRKLRDTAAEDCAPNPAAGLASYSEPE